VAERDAANVVLSFASPRGDAALDVTLPQVLEIVSTGIASSSFAEITFLEQHGPAATVATSQIGMEAGTIPYHLSGGPRLDAHFRQVVSRIDSTSTDDRWPEFCRDATAAGVHSILSLPLVVSGDGVGVLSFYAPAAFGFGVRDERIGSLFASLLALILARAPRN
jgi:hypothetical protein